MISSPILRQPRPDDAPAIAQVHAAVWRDAYAHLFPEHLLSRFGYEQRLLLWQGLLTGDGEPPLLELAEVHGTGLAGFIWSRRITDDEAAFDAEIISLNVLPDLQRHGLGRRLLGASAARLLGLGAKSCYLWVYQDNQPAQRFYEGLAGRQIDEDVETFEDVSLPTVAYAWRSLEVLIAACHAKPVANK